MNALVTLLQMRVLHDSCRAAVILGLLQTFVGLRSDAAQLRADVKTVDLPSTNDKNPYYIGNRAPLEASPFLKLPIGSITPKGWLRRQLELQADGMTGHLEEISKWCKFEDSAWAAADGQGKFGWEEL